MTETAALLFDLGGVVLRIDFERALAAWQRHSRHPLERLRALFKADDPYCGHETGEMQGDDYFAHLQRTLGLACDTAAVQEGWNRVFVDGITETLGLVDEVRERVPCFALSNTNAAHLRHMQAEFPEVLARFRKVFTSHEIGHRKPHPEAFAHVVAAIEVPAKNVLFFDDLEENVAAARKCGLQAVTVRDPGDVREALAVRGLLAGESLGR